MRKIVMADIESFATTLQHYSTAIWTVSDPDELRNYAVDGLLPRFAVIPETVEQVSQTVALANQQGFTLLTRGGGSVVKNVAGYDLNKLYIGSLGTLGIIVEANFKLQPFPVDERTLLLTFSNAEAAMHTVIALLGSLLTPSAIELIDSGAASD